ncbi:MAG TPA: hypothetical protein VFO77_06420 [Actinoplanes sp.]|nr:hypothetical protein [Actinoplanes sp.]
MRHRWTRSVEVPGSWPTRTVTITYQRAGYAPDRPERERRHGLVLLLVAPLFLAVALLLSSVWIIEPYAGGVVGPFAVISGICAVAGLANGVRLRRRGVANLAGAHTFDGRVLHHETRIVYDSEHDPYTTYFIAVDTGTATVYGWEVDQQLYESMPDGTPVRATTSADRQYLYRLSRT